MKKEEELLRSIRSVYRTAAKLNLCAAARQEAGRKLSLKQLGALLDQMEIECKKLKDILERTKERK